MPWSKDDISKLTKNELLKYINNVKKNSKNPDLIEYLTHTRNMKDYSRETLIKVSEKLWDYKYYPSKDWKK